MLLAGFQCQRQARRGEVGGTNRTHFASLDQLAICAQCVGLRCIGIVIVRLVEVDGVGLQTAQRVFHGLTNVGGLEAAALWPHGLADLGGQHHAVALAAFAQPFANDGLGLATRVARHPNGVHIGRVDEVETRVDPGVEQRKRGGFVHGPAKDVAAKSQWRYLQA